MQEFAKNIFVVIILDTNSGELLRDRPFNILSWYFEKYLEFAKNVLRTIKGLAL
jgi:hypothetical protein